MFRFLAIATTWLIVAATCVSLSAQQLAADPPRRPIENVTNAHDAQATIDYNRDIRPILSNHCFKCHGPDMAQRQSGLRLDQRETATRPADSGAAAIVPGKPDESPLVQRVFSEKADFRMPPPEHPQLTEAAKQLLRHWVAGGAAYQTHWSFQAPQRPQLPKVKLASWPRNAIDAFVLARIEAAGLAPSQPADRTTLIRRLTLDLTGLPPTIAEVDAFLADQSPDAYERLVDRLLASPNYGERMALEWLDAARYADTHGYHIDSGRDMTHWRDWVIQAFNANMPFDQFTIEQLAGDLLPNATVKQRIASGFNRNHMINFEGGAVPLEYHTAYIVDRVNTTGTVWLGMTIACAQCHDHKYDPFTQQDYYRLYAFFHNLPENGLDGSKGNAAPVLKVPTKEQQQRLDALTAELEGLQQRQKNEAAKHDSEQAKALRGQLIAQLRKDREALEGQMPTTMVMQEMPQPRETFLLIRGQYDKRGDRVQSGVPEFLPPLPEGAPRNRLGLAQWMVSPQQPLTSRVLVNRYWQMFFGTGLVKTAEDFGSQGELPSHPELLDWLAVEFRDNWDVKALLRQIVTSATYRQRSQVSADLLARDPENRLLARGARFRLPAEFIRDQALAVSGLLNRRIGGPSVFPYQPAGLWEELMSRADGAKWSAQSYTQSHGGDLYRRTMYTFWKRTSPPPTLATFDAPDRETCTVRRARTNTPLQALVLLNDPTYVEAARKLAERVITSSGSTDERLTVAFRLLTARKPDQRELPVLRRVIEQQLATYRQDPSSAAKLLKVGESSRNESLDAAELAAWTTLASMILNLDESVTRG